MAKKKEQLEFSVPEKQADRMVSIQGHEFGYMIRYNNALNDDVPRAVSTYREALDFVYAYLSTPVDKGE